MTIPVYTEYCDDGNLGSGDGCSSTCSVESGYECLGWPSSCSVKCGDGIVISPEICDDLNTVSGDGCSSDCLI